MPFNMARSAKRRAGRWIHFFVDDYQFERIWRSPERYLPMLRKFEGVIAPDFSMWADHARVEQIYNCWRNRVLAKWMQEQGLQVVPCVEWSDKASLAWCLDGLPKQSTIAVQTNGCFMNLRTRADLIRGMNDVVCNLEPTMILFYGRGRDDFRNCFPNSVWVESYCQKMKKRL